MSDVNKTVDNSPAPADTTTDVFGSGQPVEQAPAVAEEKKFGEVPDDHPKIVELKGKIEEIKNTYGGNLSSQRVLIEALQRQIDALGGNKGGEKKGEEKAPEAFVYDPKTIKFSKDLTKEEREEMTDGEIRMMDEMAQMKIDANKKFAEQNAELGKLKPAVVEDVTGEVKKIALELSKGELGIENIELANQIIESAKIMNLTGLDEKTLRERIQSAYKLLPTYKAPKEQIKKDGKAVQGDPKGDTFAENDKIIEEASKQSSGNYSL